MENSDRLSNFKVGDTITLQNPRTGKIDAEISIERIYMMSSKRYYHIKIHSRLYEHDKFISKSEDTTLSAIVGDITGHYESMDVNEDTEGAD